MKVTLAYRRLPRPRSGCLWPLRISLRAALAPREVDLAPTWEVEIEVPVTAYANSRGTRVGALSSRAICEHGQVLTWPPEPVVWFRTRADREAYIAHAHEFARAMRARQAQVWQESAAEAGDLTPTIVEFEIQTEEARYLYDIHDRP